MHWSDVFPPHIRGPAACSWGFPHSPESVHICVCQYVHVSMCTLCSYAEDQIGLHALHVQISANQGRVEGGPLDCEGVFMFRSCTSGNSHLMYIKCKASVTGIHTRTRNSTLTNALRSSKNATNTPTSTLLQRGFGVRRKPQIRAFSVLPTALLAHESASSRMTARMSLQVDAVCNDTQQYPHQKTRCCY